MSLELNQSNFCIHLEQNIFLQMADKFELLHPLVTSCITMAMLHHMNSHFTDRWFNNIWLCRHLFLTWMLNTSKISSRICTKYDITLVTFKRMEIYLEMLTNIVRTRCEDGVFAVSDCCNIICTLYWSKGTRRILSEHFAEQDDSCISFEILISTTLPVIVQHCSNVQKTWLRIEKKL